jgi:type I restriction enzyme S subunit
VGNVFSNYGGGTPNRQTPEYWNGNVPWLSSGDIKATSISTSTETITQRGLEESAARLCRKGSVLVVVRSGILKHTLPVALLETEAAINQDLKAFDSGDNRLNAWLALAWRASARQLLAENREGTTVQSVKLETLLGFDLPVPPLSEQHRIVVKLETLLEKVEASQQRLAKIPVLLRRFRQSVLAAACSGHLTADWREGQNAPGLDAPGLANNGPQTDPLVCAPETWSWLPLASLCEPGRPICYGVIKLGAERPNGIPCLRTSDVKPLHIETDGVKRIAPKISSEYERSVLRGGEVLVNVRGTLGGVAAVPPSLQGWNISREVAVVPVANALPQFVALWVASLPCQSWLSSRAKGVAYTGINIEDLRLLPVAVPPATEQREVVRRVNELFALADALEVRFAKAKEHVGKLTPSLLAKAFRGQLVPQDRNDEPASALLARVQAARRESAQNGAR